MSKNETRTFELEVGNRQLLSGFAIVVILFGVFLAMGYIVGRNSTPSPRVAVSDTSLPSSAAQPDTSRSPATPSSAPSAAAPDDTSAATLPAGLATQPAQATPQSTASAARETAPKSAGNQAGTTVADLQLRTYLQVMATKRADADVIAKTLQEKGFPTLTTPSSIEGIYRVVVGPYKDAATFASAKSDLEKSGFHPVVHKIATKNWWPRDLVQIGPGTTIVWVSFR